MDYVDSAHCQSIDNVGFNNLTEQSTQEALRLRCVIQRLPAAILVLDQYGVIQEYNPAAEKMLGLPLVHARWLDIIERELAMPQLDNEIRLRRGQVVSIATQSLGNVPGQLILVQDISADRDMQQQLHHYERLSALGKMSAALAHQIRTPLATALIYAKHLGNESLYNPEKQHIAGEFSRKLVNQIHQIESQIKDMLVFAQGKDVVFECFSLEAMLNGLRQTIEPVIENSHSQIEYISDITNIELYGNQDILCGALVNIINNAVEAVSEYAKITFNCYVKKTQIVFSIHDQGPGISEDKLQHVLEPFYSSKSHGTGLGLSVAKLVANKHGGDLLIESVEGEYTHIKIVIPIIENGKNK